jgi:hypothetical protein
MPTEGRSDAITRSRRINITGLKQQQKEKEFIFETARRHESKQMV